MSSFISGTILIVIGFLLLLKSLFGIQIPVFRILIGCGLIYWGITMITSMRIGIHPKDPNQENIYWGYHHSTVNGYEPKPKKTTYNVAFGKLELDLQKMIIEEPKQIKIHTVLGATDIFLPANVPVEIIMACCFGTIDYPFGGYSAFGTKKIRLGDRTREPVFILKVDAVFGAVSIMQENHA